MSSHIAVHSGSMVFHVPKIREMGMQDTFVSSEHEIGGIQWRLTLRRRGDVLLIILSAAFDSAGPDVLVKASACIALLSRSTPAVDCPHSIFMKDLCEYECVVNSWKDLMASKWGLIGPDGSLLVHCELSFELSVLPDFDRKSALNGTALVVDDRTFFVNRHFLASKSPYFEALLVHGFKEQNTETIELKDVSSETFLLFLRLIHCADMTLTEESIHEMLQFTDIYDVPEVRSKCENWLILQAKKMTLAMRLYLAERYNLPLARHQCIMDIQYSLDVKKPQQDDFKGFDDATINSLTRTLLNVSRTKRRDPMNTSKSVKVRSAACCVM